MKAPHLWPALAALLIAASVLSGGYLQARRLESRYVHALAPQQFSEKLQGSALQREAFAQPDLLPIYGSSELELKNTYHANTLFKNYPTDFTVFPVGQLGTSALVILQKLAAIGPDLAGKKIVISFTPPPFFRGMIAQDTYAGNFSPLHASALAFSSDLSDDLKQKVARRMLEYGPTLEHLPLTRFALEQLAAESVWSKFLYYAVFPLGKLQNAVLSLQDHWITLLYISHSGDLNPDIEHRPAELDWPSLARTAETEYRGLATNNPFGITPHVWKQDGKRLSRQVNAYPGGTMPLVKAIRQMGQTMANAREWNDLDLLLEALHEFGAKPLVLSTPMKGCFYAFWGVPYKDRQSFYSQIGMRTKTAGFPSLNFASHDGDTFFALDPACHLSTKGWVYYCRALDAFYHAREVGDTGSLIADLPRGPGPAPDGSGRPIPEYEGIHDLNGPVTINGWAWDTTQPDKPVKLDILDGTKLVKTITADKFSEGLLKAGKGNGAHGFALPVPPELRDGQPHTIRVRIAGTSLDLKNTPRALKN